MQAAKKPHIIIFNPDQWRSDVMGHLGNKAAQTPHLDQMVQTEAISFANAFCQNTVCTPSRCSFMTGWYPHVRGHRSMNYMLKENEGEPNLLKIMQENGYFVWWGGKNDLLPGDNSYQDSCDILFTPENIESTWSIDKQEEWRGKKNSDSYYSFYVGKLPQTPGYKHYNDGDWACIEEAVNFLNSYQGDKPLCMFLALTYPHPPYAVEEPWFSKINKSLLPRRTPTPQDWQDKPAILKGIQEGQNLQNWSEERWIQLRSVYYGMCARVDEQFSHLTAALKNNSMYDNSAIFFFSDHGDFTGDYGLVEKNQNTFEDCLSKVPFIFKPPANINIKPGARDALVELIDFSATVYDLCAINPEYDSFGKSLIPLLTENKKEFRDAVFCEGGRRRNETQAAEISALVPEYSLYHPRVNLQQSETIPYHSKATMCRTQKYKYVRRLYEKDELYDLDKDPEELHNIIDDDHYYEILINLKERMLLWYQETCDIVPQKTDARGF